MENQELMRLCFEIVKVMDWAKNCPSQFSEVTGVKGIEGKPIMLTACQISALVAPYMENELILEEVRHVLDSGFKSSLFSTYQKEGVIMYFR